MMQLIDSDLLDQVSDSARKSTRLRMNHNFHDSLDAKAQRLLNALEPGTLLPVHRHLHTAETYLLLRGKIRVLFYNDRKEIEITVDGYTFIPDLRFMNEHAVCRYCGQIYMWDYDYRG